MFELEDEVELKQEVEGVELQLEVHREKCAVGGRGSTAGRDGEVELEVEMERSRGTKRRER